MRENIYILYSNSVHLDPRTGLPDKILKGDHQRIILAKLESMIGPVVEEENN